MRDRKIRTKHQLYVAGVRVFEYWATQFITYFLLFAIPVTVAIGLVFGSHMSALTGVLLCCRDALPVMTSCVQVPRRSRSC